MKQQIEDEEEKYRLEHEECDEFFVEVVEEEKAKFDVHYTQWKNSVVKFHQIKQEHAIKTFVEKLDSKLFVNPQSRVDIFGNMKQEQ